MAYTSRVELTNGKSLGTLGRRERPHLLLKDGVPTHLYNGVCLGTGATGFGQNVTGPDHCFTFVQEISPSSFDWR